MLSQRETNTAFLTHLSSFLSFVFPFGNILGPLIMWSINKERSEFVDENGLEAVNFNISYTIYMIVLGMIMFPFAFGSLSNYIRNVSSYDYFDFHFNIDFDNMFGVLSIASIIAVVGLLQLVLIIVAAIKASRGEVYNYPFTIKFIK